MRNWAMGDTRERNLEQNETTEEKENLSGALDKNSLEVVCCGNLGRATNATQTGSRIRLLLFKLRSLSTQHRSTPDDRLNKKTSETIENFRLSG
jgi:hypothetical protein